MPQFQNPFQDKDVLIETEEERRKALERPVNPFTGETEVARINPFTNREERFDVKGLTLAQRARDAGLNDKIGTDAPTGIFSSVIDLLLRGQFGAAKLIDGLLQTETASDIGAALSGAFKEIIAPEERLSFSDILKVQKAEAKGGPLTTGESVTASVLGFALDVALDPTTYLTFGVGGGIKITSKAIRGLSFSAKETARFVGSAKGLNKFQVALTKEGKELLNAALKEGRALGVKTVENRRTAEEAIGALYAQDVLGVANKKVSAFIEANTAVNTFTGNAKSLFDLGGIKIGGKTLVTSEQLSAFGKMTGLTDAKDAIKRIPFVQRMNELPLVGRDRLTSISGDTLTSLASRQGLSRSRAEIIGSKFKSVELLDKMPFDKVKKVTGLVDEEIEIAKKWASSLVGKKHEYIIFRQASLNRIIQFERQIYQQTKDGFQNLTKDQREKIGTVAAQIRDDTKRALEDPKAFEGIFTRGEQHRDAAGRFINKFDPPGFGGAPIILGPKEARLIAEDVIERKGLRKDPEAFKAFTLLRDTMSRLGREEVNAGMLNHVTLNYLPARYQAISSVRGFLDFRRNWINRVGATFTPDNARKFADTIAAQDAGFDPVFDAAMLYAIRANESKQAFQAANFQAGVKSIFGVKSLDQLPKEIGRDLHFVGDTFYNTGGIPEVKKLLSAHDKFLSVFRKAATVLRPSFAVRQVFSNQLQSFAILGAKTIKAFDPRTIGESLFFVTGKSDSIKHIRTALGDVITGKEFQEELFEQGIIRNVTIEAQGRVTGFRGAKKIANEIDLNTFLTKFSGSQSAAEGMSKFITGATRYTDWASHVEDLSRTSLYLNARKLGHSPEDAKGLVEKGLFDYLHGLGEIETNLVRRIIPFYTFNRFAIPLIASTVATTPGRAAGFFKAGKEFYQVWNKISSGDTLNDSERRLIPGYLLEQPTAFGRLDKGSQDAIFNTFNNFSFLDVMGFLDSQENGEIDVRGMMAKASIAQISPF